MALLAEHADDDWGEVLKEAAGGSCAEAGDLGDAGGGVVGVASEELADEGGALAVVGFAEEAAEVIEEAGAGFLVGELGDGVGIGVGLFIEGSEEEREGGADAGLGLRFVAAELGAEIGEVGSGELGCEGFEEIHGA